MPAVETLFRTWHLTLHLATTAIHNMHVLMKINCPLWFVFTAFNAELQIIELKQLADIFLHFQTLYSHHWILHETKRIQKGKALREHKLNKKIYASIQVTEAYSGKLSEYMGWVYGLSLWFSWPITNNLHSIKISLFEN